MKLLILLLLILGFTCNAYTQTSEALPDIIERIKPSVVSVIAFDKDERIISRGTGFCVGLNRIITNNHVIESSVRIEIQTNDRTTYKVIRIESFDKNSDLALLQTEQLNQQLKPLQITNSIPRVGEKVLVVGNPRGLEGSVSDGIVSAFRIVPNIGKLIQITAPISPGSSGSPVINMKGEVIGVATLNLEGGQNLNFAISAEKIVSLWPNIISLSNEKSVSVANASNRWRLLLGKDISYDTETFTKKLGVVSTWIQYKEPRGNYEKVLTEINCIKSQIRSVRSLSYRKDGDLIQQNDRLGNWRSFVPDSNGEQMYKIFCEDQLDYQSMVDWSRRTELDKQADKFMELKDYGQAIDVFNQIIQEFPLYPSYLASAYFGIGKAKREQGKLQEAKTFILKAINLEANSYYYSVLGEIYKSENNLTAAGDAFWKALRLDEQHIAGKWELREIYEDAKNFNGLVDLYKFLIAKGGFENNYSFLAYVYEKQGQIGLARSTRLTGVNALEQKIKLGKFDKYTYWSLANLYKLLNNPSKEQQTLIFGIDKFPDDHSLTLQLAESYNKNKQWTNAVRVIKNVLPYVEDLNFKRQLLEELKASFQALNQFEDVKKIEQELSNLQP